MNEKNATHLDAIRRQLPSVNQTKFLNTGSCGPLPTIVGAAMAQLAQRELEIGRANLVDSIPFAEQIRNTRAAVGRIFNIEPSAVALTHHTTEGMNIVTWGIEWQPGDEIVTTTLEHPGGLYPLYTVRARRGVLLRFADVGLGNDPLPVLERAVNSRTRLIVLSHVSYSSGARFPLADIVQFAHSRGVMVAVDGAQSSGAFDVDLTALNVDFYAIPGQKWLCGPEGTGALYIRPDRLADLQPTFVGYGSFDRHDWHGHFLPMPDASRFHTSSAYRPGIIGQLTALKWFHDTVKPSWAYQRIAQLANHCRTLLEELPNVRVITPPHRQAGLVNFLPLGWSPRHMAGLTRALIDRGYIIRSISHEPFCLRVSTGFFNTHDELTGLRDALGELLDDGPDAIEIPELSLNLPDEPVWMDSRQD